MYGSSRYSTYGGYGTTGSGSRSYGYGSLASDTASNRSWGSGRSYGSGGSGTYSSGSYSFGGERPNLDRSLSYASVNRGNVTSLKDRFTRAPSVDRLSSRDYGRTSGYTSDIGGGSGRSYGSSYDRPISARSFSREPSLSRMDSYGSSSRIKDLGTTTYGSSYTPSSSRQKASDYVLTPFQSRRTTENFPTKTARSYERTNSDSTALRGYDRQPSRESLLSMERTASKESLSPYRQTSRDAEQSQTTRNKSVEPQSVSKKQTQKETGRPRSSRSRTYDSSSESASEPSDPEDRDPNVQYLTSRGTDPAESDDSSRPRRTRREKRLSRTKTKVYPKKVYRRRRDRPQLANKLVQIDARELENNVKKPSRFIGSGSDRYSSDRYLSPGQASRQPSLQRSTSTNAAKKDIPKDMPKVGGRVSAAASNLDIREKDAQEEFVRAKREEEDRKARRNSITSVPTRRKTETVNMPKQSTFQVKRRPGQTDTEDEEADVVADRAERLRKMKEQAKKDEEKTPKQTSFLARRKANQAATVAPLTPENLSLKDSIDKVKSWKKQLKNEPPDSPNSPISPMTPPLKRHVGSRSPRQQAGGDKAKLKANSSVEDNEDLVQKEWRKSELNRTKSKFQQPIVYPGKQRNQNDVGSPSDAFSHPGSPKSPLSPKSRQKQKLCAGVPQFPVEEKDVTVNKSKKTQSIHENNRLKPGKSRNERSPSPYDNVENKSSGNRVKPTKKKGILKHADSMMSIGGDISASEDETSLKRFNSMDTVSSLPDVVPPSESSKRSGTTGFFSRVTDIDSLLDMGTDEEFEDFSDEEAIVETKNRKNQAQSPKKQTPTSPSKAPEKKKPVQEKTKKKKVPTATLR